MTNKLRLLDRLPSAAQKRTTSVEDTWNIVRVLMERKIVQVRREETSEAKLIAIEDMLDRQQWKMEIYEDTDNNEVFYLRAFNWIVADGKTDF